jgi:hypothetical protein
MQQKQEKSDNFIALIKSISDGASSTMAALYANGGIIRLRGGSRVQGGADEAKIFANAAREILVVLSNDSSGVGARMKGMLKLIHFDDYYKYEDVPQDGLWRKMETAGLVEVSVLPRSALTETGAKGADPRIYVLTTLGRLVALSL